MCFNLFSFLGHFFGLSCIEKWLNSTGGNDCPTCNEKATKRDIRPHYVHKLIAIDTADRDRALEQVETLKKELRTLELEMATLKVANVTLREENEKLKNSYICSIFSNIRKLFKI